ncbi:adhesion G protein-coupled receptor E5-like isoform X2 [Hemitrygon akajei]|uniref:adhesion G protein-coupled receptor E5-like isoform X2 n=1 Tax=Hemitrygon akajei TaxID=2704970 RepID=UPI003BF9F996
MRFLTTYFILGLLCCIIYNHLENKGRASVGASGSCCRLFVGCHNLMNSTAFVCNSAYPNNTQVNVTSTGKVSIQLDMSKLEIQLSENEWCKENTSVIFVKWRKWGITNILYQNNGTRYTFPVASELVTVKIANASENIFTQPINITFNKNSMGDNFVCAYLVIENCTAMWSSDNSSMLENGTSITCSYSQSSTFTVLQRIASLEKIGEIATTFHQKTSMEQTTTESLKTMENLIQNASRDIVKIKEARLRTEQLEVVIQAYPIEKLPNSTAKLSTESASIELMWEAIKGENPTEVVCIGIVILKGSQSGLDTGYLSTKPEVKSRLASDVLTVSISGMKTGNLSSPIIFSLNLAQKKAASEISTCVFWEHKGEGKENGWNTAGCNVHETLPQNTICSCTHLTSFAVLLSQAPIPVADRKNLELITYVGVSLSVFCLLLSVIIFLYCRSIRSIRITIHTHLCLSMLLAESLFLVNSSKIKNEVACKIVAICLHYLFLVCFAWMLLEGIQLYFMVVKVFHSRSLQKKYLFLVGYGTPLIIVIVTVACNIDAYQSPNCWLNLKSGFIFAFIGPVCAIIGLNSIFFIITIWKLADKFSMLNLDVPYYKKMRSFMCTAIGQLILLGGTWIFGMLHFNEETVVMAYIFTVINSFQGFFILILHCLLNKQVRTELWNRLSNISTSMSVDTRKGTNWKGLQNSQESNNFKSTTNIVTCS